MTVFSTISVTGAQPYDVVIGENLSAEITTWIQHAGVASVGIVVQPSLEPQVATLIAAIESLGMSVVKLMIPDAEHGKTFAVCERLWGELGEAGFTRHDLLIGFGGGAATDLAGFVAATWMRGMKVVHIPTSLLAAVDAAVGGKTGINTAQGKNLVGAFHEPAAVFIDVAYLRTLPQAELVAGSAEIIKTGLIADTEILARYEENPASCLDVSGYLPELIARSVAVKASVVSQDLKESGLREILNYGHTFGHAVELAEHYTWRHGNAVAVGMMFVAYLSQARGLIDEAFVQRHRNILHSVGLPTSYTGSDFATLYAAMTRDKKNRNGNIRFVALTGAGNPTRIEDATYAQLQDAYQRLASDPRA